MSILCCQKAFQIIQNLQHIFWTWVWSPPPLLNNVQKKCGSGGGWLPLCWWSWWKISCSDCDGMFPGKHGKQSENNACTEFHHRPSCHTRARNIQAGNWQYSMMPKFTSIESGKPLSAIQFYGNKFSFKFIQIWNRRHWSTFNNILPELWVMFGHNLRKIWKPI